MRDRLRGRILRYGDGPGVVAMSETRRIHFITGEPSPTLRCRFFGHEYVDATTFEDADEIGAETVEICRRCKSLKGKSWDGIRSVRTGPSRVFVD